MRPKVGFLGAGLIATYHSNMLRGSGADHQIASVFDTDSDRASRFASATGATVAPSEEALVDSVDAVYVCTWTSEHPRLVSLAAQRGRAVFCEKPVATSLAGALDSVAAVEQAGVVNQVGLVLRDSPAFLLLRHLVGREEYGRATAVVFRDDQYIPVQGMYASTWRGDVARAGAGTLLEHSIHDLDLLEWLLGPVASVSGQTGFAHGIEGIEDNVVALVVFERGAIGSLTSVWHDVMDRPSQRRVEVFCERAHLVLEGDVFGPVRWTDAAGEHVLEGDALIRELRSQGVRLRNPDGAFVEAVSSGQPATPSMADALRAHLLVESVYSSAASGGEPVAVPSGRPEAAG